MAYNKNTWADGPSGGTPLSAARLSHMEDGIAAAAALDDVGDTTTPTGAALNAAAVAAVEDADTVAPVGAWDFAQTPKVAGAVIGADKADIAHTHTAAQVSDASTVGRSVLTATDAAAARSAIGALATAARGAANGVASLGADGLLPYPQLPLSGLAGLHANAIFNGDMILNQSGISVNPLVHLSKTSDRWIYGQSSAGAVMRWDVDADVPDSTVQNSSTFTTVTAAAVAADQEKHVRYAIEGSDFQAYKGQVATLSFWVKTAVAGTYCVAFTNSARDRTFVANYTVNTAATWEKKSITVDFGAVSGGTWDYGAGQGIGIRFALAVGANYAGTAGVWNSANVVGSSAQTDVGAVAGRYWKLAKVQLNLGATALPYFHRPLIDTFRLCTRYLYVVRDGFLRRTPTSSVTTAAVTEMYLPLPTRLRALPKVSIGGVRGTDWALRTTADADNTTGTLLAAPAFGRDYGLVRFESGTYTAGTAFHLLLLTSTASIVFDAEL